jgi:hypothetical protein
MVFTATACSSSNESANSPNPGNSPSGFAAALKKQATLKLGLASNYEVTSKERLKVRRYST